MLLATGSWNRLVMPRSASSGRVLASSIVTGVEGSTRLSRLGAASIGSKLFTLLGALEDLTRHGKLIG